MTDLQTILNSNCAVSNQLELIECAARSHIAALHGTTWSDCPIELAASILNDSYLRSCAVAQRALSDLICAGAL